MVLADDVWERRQAIDGPDVRLEAEDSAADAANVEGVRDCVADMRQFSDGSVYLDFPGFFEGGDELLETTFGGACERLEA